MKSFFVSTICFLLLSSCLAGCSDPKPTVIEPTNDEQMDMLRSMVESETTAESNTDQERDE